MSKSVSRCSWIMWRMARFSGSLIPVLSASRRGLGTPRSNRFGLLGAGLLEDDASLLEEASWPALEILIQAS